ncbi:MAG TPA: LuxR C-terminal-related transcriptional regulator [Roseiflexaceae bacterium]|nr:LuxR C-terminal-related transcriptional regulator [Roseiflexaceae bacterium]
MRSTEGVVEGGRLRVERDGVTTEVALGGPEWFAWLVQAERFVVETPQGRITVRKEQAGSGRGGWYWRAYRKRAGRLRRVYLGPDAELTAERLHAAVAELLGPDEPAPPVPNNAAVPNSLPGGSEHMPPILATKLAAPALRPGLVARPELAARLRAGVAGPLTLLVAPAGFGKTTLLAQTLAGQSDPIAWLTLDSGDDDPHSLLLAVCAALEAGRPGVAAEALALLRLPAPPAPEAAAGRLLHGLASLDRTVVLALDDYHTLRDPAAQRLVALLLERAPPALRLLVAGRSEPALPVARLRAQALLTEITAADLRFSPPEAAMLLRLPDGRALGPREAAALTQRTEGWAAGLQLAALALRGQPDPARFIADFAGTHRFIMDYLIDEVLRQQPPHLRRFLLHTSILERLCAPLCEAVGAGGERQEPRTKSQEPHIHRRDAEDTEGEMIAAPRHLWDEPSTQNSTLNTQNALEVLERGGMFLVPLDAERRWYRYHQLFAEVLRAELRREGGPALVAELHRRAAAWYAAQIPVEGAPALDAAIGHALAGGDAARAATLVEQAALPALMRGETAAFRRWLEALPADLVRERPFLSLAAVGLLPQIGDAAAADRHLDDAARALDLAVARRRAAPDAPGQPAPDELAVVRAEILAARGVVACARGELERAAGQLLDALAALPDGQPALHWRVAVNLGQVYALDGRPEAARLLLETSQRLAGDTFARFLSHAQLAWFDMGAGRLRRSAEGFRRALASASAEGWGEMPLVSDVQIGLGSVLVEQARPEEALPLLERGLRVATESGLSFQILAGELARVRLHQLRGQMAEARAALEAAERAVAAFAIPWLRARIDAARLELGVAVEPPPPPEGPPGYSDAPLLLWRARAALAAGAPRHALELLLPLERAARRRGWGNALLATLALLALACAADDRDAQALDYLRAALDRAGPERHLLPLLREGPALAVLLHRLPAHPYRALALAAFGEWVAAAPAQDMAEPLTAREREVLGLLAGGASNAEIARALVVAVSTAKAHVSSLLAKLGARSRSQAVAIARERGLLAQ